MSGAGGSGGVGGPAAGASEGLTRRQWVTLVVVTLSTFLVLLDVSVVNVALPQILGDLGGTLDGATWVAAGYVLSFAALLVLFGKLGDVYGRRRVFAWGAAVFAVASLACALAPSLGFLIGARVAQGVGAAMLTPSTLSLIKATFPKEKLGLAFGVEGITAGVATALGPTLGGFLTTSLSWRWIFLVNVPLAVLAIVAVLLAVAESRDEGASRRFDVPGTLLSVVGPFFLVFALIEGQKLGWGSPAILGSFAVAAASLASFVLVERRVREPLVDLSLFGDRVFAVGNALRGLVLFVLLGTVFVLPLFWQTQLGYSALQSALVFLPLSVVSFFFSPVAGSLADRYDARWLVGFGFAVAAVAAWWLSRLTPESGWAFYLAPLALFGLGLSFLLASTVTAPLRGVPEAKGGQASGILNASGEVGSQLGLAVAAAVLQNRLVAGVEESLSGSGLPPRAAEGVRSGLSEGGLEAAGAPGSGGLDPAAAEEIQGIVRDAFAGAVGTGLLFVAAAALLGCVLALVFFSARPEPEAGGTREGERAARPVEAPGPGSAAEGTHSTGETVA